MAHYAILDENNIVIDVIVGNDEGDTDWEEYYGNIANAVCKRTSYNTEGNQHANGKIPFRLNYAGIGYEYREDLDGFIPPKPYPSWVLDEAIGLWVAPVARPEQDGIYLWNENSVSWTLVDIEVPVIIEEPDYIIQEP